MKKRLLGQSLSRPFRFLTGHFVFANYSDKVIALFEEKTDGSYVVKI